MYPQGFRGSWILIWEYHVIVDVECLQSSTVPQTLVYLGWLKGWWSSLVIPTKETGVFWDWWRSWRSIRRTAWSTVVRWSSLSLFWTVVIVWEAVAIDLMLLNERNRCFQRMIGKSSYSFPQFKHRWKWLLLRAKPQIEFCSCLVIGATVVNLPVNLCWVPLRRPLLVIASDDNDEPCSAFSSTVIIGVILVGSLDELDDFSRLLLSCRVYDGGLLYSYCNFRKEVAWRAKLPRVTFLCTSHWVCISKQIDSTKPSIKCLLTMIHCVQVHIKVRFSKEVWSNKQQTYGLVVWS